MQQYDENFGGYGDAGGDDNSVHGVWWVLSLNNTCMVSRMTFG